MSLATRSHSPKSREVRLFRRLLQSCARYPARLNAPLSVVHKSHLPIARPDRVRKCVTVGNLQARQVRRTCRQFFQASAVLADMELMVPVQGGVGLGKRTWAAADDGPEVEAKMRSWVRGMFAQGDLPNSDPPAFDRLPEIHVPTNLVIGDLDHAMVVDCANAIGAHLVGCRVSTVHGADHTLPLREPERLAEPIAVALTRCG